MPFPLAHPAAVLPLRRFCPARLSLSALMIGSLAPDASYFLWQFKIPEFAHTFLGSLGFCLPAGMLMFLVFHVVRGPLVNALPAPHREALQPLSRLPHGPPLALLLSLMIGTWTHLALDAATRESQVVVAHLPVFQEELVAMKKQGFQPYRLLWYALTAGGLGWLGAAYRRFLRKSTGSRCWFASWDLRRYGLWALLLLMPGLLALPSALRYAQGWPQIYAVRQFFYVWSAYCVVGAGTALMLVGFVLRARQEIRRRRAAIPSRSRAHTTGPYPPGGGHPHAGP
jgi:hypothetical protein